MGSYSHVDLILKAKAIEHIRAGRITIAEAAQFAGVSKGAVSSWIMLAGINWRAARKAWLEEQGIRDKVMPKIASLAE